MITSLDLEDGGLPKFWLYTIMLVIFQTFNILCHTLELVFYWAHKPDILQQFLSWHDFFPFFTSSRKRMLPLWTCRQCWCRGCSSCQALCWWRLGCLWQQTFPSDGSCTLELIGSPTKFHSFVGIIKENAFNYVMHQKYVILKCGKILTCSGSSRNSSRNREWQTLQNRFASPQMMDRWKIYPASIDELVKWLKYRQI